LPLKLHSLMMTNYQTPTSRIDLAAIARRIFTSGKITRDDEYCFFQAIAADHALSPDELKQIQRISQHLDMGLLKVSD
jgi:hypothetical protein